MNEQKQPRILIINSSTTEREELSDMLSDRYKIDVAEQAEQAFKLFSSKGPVYSMFLIEHHLDGCSALEILEQVKNQKWIENIPVIITASKIEKESIMKAYEFGVADFLIRPFDRDIFRQRVENLIELFCKQQKMIDLVSEKLYESERQSSLMVAILSHIVEFRNGESGTHVLNITAITRLILSKLETMEEAKRYRITENDIAVMSKAAALHDIGKISISDLILNKPGKLTDEEYEIMKNHAKIGADILKHLGQFQDDPLIKTAADISHWHHERWDGNGYPDGLKEDQIPISAQVVSLADAYDALVSKRCYKRAFSHSEALKMIKDGACGVFNPLLLKCLFEVSEELETLGRRGETLVAEYEKANVENDIQECDMMHSMDAFLQKLQASRIKIRFLSEQIQDPVFEYYYETALFEVSPGAAKYFGLKETTIDPIHNETILRMTDVNSLAHGLRLAKETTPEDPEFSLNVKFKVCGEYRLRHVHCKTIWVSTPPKRYGIIGRIYSK